VTLHSGPGRNAYLLLPIIPGKLRANARIALSAVIPDAAKRRSGIQMQTLSECVSGFRVRAFGAPRNDSRIIRAESLTGASVSSNAPPLSIRLRSLGMALDFIPLYGLYSFIPSNRGRCHETSFQRDGMRLLRARLVTSLWGGPGHRLADTTVRPPGAG
jgi:hypothetical protein